MILVVYGHACTDFSYINQWICSFFMGLFFISSGYTYRYKSNWVKNNLQKIYLPYLIWGLVGVVYAFAKAYMSEELQNVDICRRLYVMALGIGSDNYPLWFLTAFFVSKSVYDLICAVIESRIFDRVAPYRQSLEVILVLSIAFAGYIYTLNKPLGHSIMRFDTGLIMLPFFNIGRYLPNAFEYIQRKKILTVVFWVSLSINLISGLLLNDLVSVCSNVYGNIFLFYISTITGSIAIYVACLYLERLGVINRILSHFGKYSLTLLCSHAFVLAVLISFVLVLCPTVRYYPIIITLACLSVIAPVLPLMHKILSVITKITPLQRKNINDLI